MSQESIDEIIEAGRIAIAAGRRSAKEAWEVQNQMGEHNVADGVRAGMHMMEAMLSAMVAQTAMTTAILELLQDKEEPSLSSKRKDVIRKIRL